MQSPFEFKKFGESGVEISEIFSKLGERVDDICVINSMYTDLPFHEPSLLMLNCVSTLARWRKNAIANLWTTNFASHAAKH